MNTETVISREGDTISSIAYEYYGSSAEQRDGMKSMIYAAAVIAVLLAVAAVQGFTLSARAKKIDTLTESVEDAKKELKAARESAELYRARVEELQVQNDALQIRLAADAGKVRQAAANNPQWALQPLPSDVAAVLEGLDK